MRFFRSNGRSSTGANIVVDVVLNLMTSMSAKTKLYVYVHTHRTRTGTVSDPFGYGAELVTDVR